MTKIYHFDSFGKRQEKYGLLNNTEFQDVNWKELELKEPYYFFVPKDFGAKEKYDEGFSIGEIFLKNSMGIATGKDEKLVSFNEFENEKTTLYNYRLFDIRYTIYDNKILQRARTSIMDNLYNLKDNYSLVTTKYYNGRNFTYCFISNLIFDRALISSGSYSFPLYLYQENKLENKTEKTPNFNPEIILQIEEKLKLKHGSNFTPENLFDYIYAVLHSKTYRETYKEFLKIDFPKITFDVTQETFFKLVKLGEELRSYHLLENPNLIAKNFITKYEIEGNNLVEKIRFENEKVYINDTQFFLGVPKEVFEFYIGGYQPAQKWLKDRKDRQLNYDDIIHYSKMILSLSETIRIMGEIE